MRISDWSSDVCSSDLIAIIMPRGTLWTRNVQLAELDIGTFVTKMFEKKLKEPVQINCGLIGFTVRDGVAAADPILQIGRASCRERVCQYVLISVVADSVKKKNYKKCIL